MSLPQVPTIAPRKDPVLSTDACWRISPLADGRSADLSKCTESDHLCWSLSVQGSIYLFYQRVMTDWTTPVHTRSSVA